MGVLGEQGGFDGLLGHAAPPHRARNRCEAVVPLLYAFFADQYNAAFGVMISLAISAAALAPVLWCLGRIIRHRMETADSVRQMASLVDSSDHAIIGLTADGTITHWNRGGEKTFGYAAEEIRGRPVSLLVPPEGSDELREILEGVRAGRSVGHYRTFHLKRDGIRIPVVVTASPVKDAEGEIQGSAMVVHDISARHQTEMELREAHETLQASLNEVELRNRQSALLSEMTDLLQSCHAREEAYPLIAQYIQQLFPSDSGALYLLGSSRTLVETAVSWGPARCSKDSFSPEECWALRRGKAHLLKRSAAAAVCKHITEEPLAGALCLPIIAQGEMFAVLHIRIGADEAALPADHWEQSCKARKKLATNAAEHVGLSLANLKLREQLRRQSVRDPLTGSFNRGYLEESLEREIDRAIRSSGPITVIMIDIDHFKQFNDSFGHDAGDALLREVAYFLREQTRTQDIACRYGGEEFTLILPDASLDDGRQRAEQLRRDARNIRVKHEGQMLGRISLSLGVAAFPKNGSRGADLMKAADQALYRAKAEGHDRVAVAA